MEIEIQKEQEQEEENDDFQAQLNIKIEKYFESKQYIESREELDNFYLQLIYQMYGIQKMK